MCSWESPDYMIYTFLAGAIVIFFLRIFGFALGIAEFAPPDGGEKVGLTDESGKAPSEETTNIGFLSYSSSGVAAVSSLSFSAYFSGYGNSFA